MCHQTCLTCSSELFNQCLTCQPNLTLLNGVCYCDLPWDATCTIDSQFRQSIAFLTMFILLITVFVSFLYLLRVRMIYSYKIIHGLQAVSLLLYSKSIYFSYEDSQILKSMHHSLGPYLLSYRLEALNFTIVIQTGVFLLIVVFFYLTLYSPCYIFVQKYMSYLWYLKNNALYFLHSGYIFGSRLIFLFIGLFVNNITTDPIILVGLSIYGIIILITLVSVFYQYHKNTLDLAIYTNTQYMYNILTPICMVGIGLVSDKYLLIIIYCIPIILLVIVAVLNRQDKILTINNLLFIMTEIYMAMIAILVLLFNDSIQTYVLVACGFACCMMIFLQAIYLNYLNIPKFPQKQGGRKVHPVPTEQNTESQILEKKKKNNFEDFSDPSEKQVQDKRNINSKINENQRKDSRLPKKKNSFKRKQYF